MEKLMPGKAAVLARLVYAVQDEAEAEIFMLRPEFSQKQRTNELLTAQVGSRLINVPDAFGICALGANEYIDDVFIIFRGTNTEKTQDLVTNARFGVGFSDTGLPVHTGFNQVISSMLPDIKAFLNENHIRGTVHCIGHSLGGAVASLCADWVKRNYANPVKLYTFGAPRIGMMFFSWLFTSRFQEKNIYRIYHPADPIPMVPVFPFMQIPFSGRGYAVTNGGGKFL